MRGEESSEARRRKHGGWGVGLRVCALLLVVSGRCWGQASVLTYHNDNRRSGLNSSETLLTPTNMAKNFGQLFAHGVDGEIYAQPLYVANLSIPGKGTHNVVLVNTEHDSVYAFDADSNANGNAAPLWQISLIDSAHGAAAGATSVPSSAYPVDSDNLPDCGGISPELGSTSTPVIDAASGTLYVEAFSYEGGSYVHRLHALDLATGAEKTFGPVVISGTVAGTGDGGTTVSFNPYLENNRAALLLANGTVYVGFATSCGDQGPFHGWIFAYAAGTLTQQGTFLTTPNGGLGGIWMTGSGPAADASGNVYLPTGNGLFDTVNNPATDFGDSILKLSLGGGGLGVADYFTPYNQQTLADNDVDVSSGGLMLLPDQPGPYPHELVAAGKEGRIYLINRDQFTLLNQHYCANCASDPQIVQESASGELDNGVFSSPVYWNGTVYYSTPDLYLKAFPLVNGLVNYGGVSISTDAYNWPGANLSISGNGTSNGIIWALKTDAYATGGAAVLRAYDAANLNNRLYSSDQNANDAAGPAVRFTVPTVVNGKVYVGSHDRVSVYGLLSGTPTPTPSSTPTSTFSSLPTPTLNPTHTATPTVVVTPTPTPSSVITPTFTPTPTATATPSGSIAIVTAPSSANHGCGETAGNVMNIGTANAKVNAGDTLMLVVGLAPGAHVTGITNGYGAIGDVWQEASNVYGNDTNGGATYIWFASNIVGNTNGAPITINTTKGNTFIGACLFEVQGLATSNPQDGGATLDTTTPVTTLLSPAISGSSAPELFVTVSACANLGNSTASVGGIQFNAINGATNGVGGCPAGYYIASAPGSYQAALTQSPPGSGVVAIASFHR
jgi:hypothetical protein